MKQLATREEAQRIFVSYSRTGAQFADQVVDAFVSCRSEATLDRHDISGGEEWKARLRGLILEADSVVRSARTSADGSSRRRRGHPNAIPSVPQSLAGMNVPQQLPDLNYIICYGEEKVPGSGFGSGLKQLALV